MTGTPFISRLARVHFDQEARRVLDGRTKGSDGLRRIRLRRGPRLERLIDRLTALLPLLGRRRQMLAGPGWKRTLRVHERSGEGVWHCLSCIAVLL